MLNSIPKFLGSFLSTIGLLIAAEVASSGFMPALGFEDSQFAFNVVIIIYFALKLRTFILPWMILIVQFLHSAFSIEGWALGTIAGIFLSILASYLKDFLQLTSGIMTIVITFLFQILWYLITITILCLKLGHFDRFFLLLGNAIGPVIFISLVSPLLFSLLDRIWNVEKQTLPQGLEI
jgi:hypothetical protein